MRVRSESSQSTGGCEHIKQKLLQRCVTSKALCTESGRKSVLTRPLPECMATISPECRWSVEETVWISGNWLLPKTRANSCKGQVVTRPRYPARSPQLTGSVQRTNSPRCAIFASGDFAIRPTMDARKPTGWP
jgi:hypothetical protein